jgi:hypothetical protein
MTQEKKNHLLDDEEKLRCEDFCSRAENWHQSPLPGIDEIRGMMSRNTINIKIH